MARARLKGIKRPHPLGSVPTRSGISLLTAESGITITDMLGVKISGLPAAGTANDSDQMEVNQGGTSRRLTLDQVAELVVATGGGASVTTSDTPPDSPADGDLWWDSTLGTLLVWYVDADSGQWISATPSTGGGSGDLDTTPVAARGSSLAQPLPDWLAGAPIVSSAADELTLLADHVGAWLYVTNNVGVLLRLPNNWLAGWSVGVRQMGAGPVIWVTNSGATMQVPATRAGHNQILEQYEEVVFRVVSNATGTAAVWSISGATS